MCQFARSSALVCLQSGCSISSASQTGLRFVVHGGCTNHSAYEDGHGIKPLNPICSETIRVFRFNSFTATGDNNWLLHTA